MISTWSMMLLLLPGPAFSSMGTRVTRTVIRGNGCRSSVHVSCGSASVRSYCDGRFRIGLCAWCHSISSMNESLSPPPDRLSPVLLTSRSMDGISDTATGPNSPLLPSTWDKRGALRAKASEKARSDLDLVTPKRMTNTRPATLRPSLRTQPGKACTR
ncbi:hypothetical protein B0T26DRAFT_689559 [Lasiosphaeria miniovina]|uniref:Secreted protein n=1 Tax=Lasiosphaeria miniovina TaxID=1954250 RepID=A0AA40BIC4_9PEZI|nr:uncharacterized protein B0T26DRAFT_689559 [Lasiosphaeria miniovina]KAK0734747.1 hypothetical protein B0T26DRAFT_689559 [Lasiosphaeria miniovina]